MKDPSVLTGVGKLLVLTMDFVQDIQVRLAQLIVPAVLPLACRLGASCGQLGSTSLLEAAVLVSQRGSLFFVVGFFFYSFF